MDLPSTTHSPNSRTLNGRKDCNQDSKKRDFQVQNQGQADPFLFGIVPAEFLP